MRKFQSTIPAAGLAEFLAGCGQEEMANDTAANADARADAGMNSMMNDSGNPFAQSETAMQQGMMAAVGGDVSDTWAKKMIEHHKGAIAMSEIVLGQTKDARIRPTAEKIRVDQSKEMAMVGAMLRAAAKPSV